MKSTLTLIAAGLGLVHAELARYPSRGLPDSICTTAPYKQFLPLSEYASATDFCSTRFAIGTPNCGTTTSQDTVTTTYTGARQTLSVTGTVTTTRTVTRTARPVTICSSSPGARRARRQATRTRTTTRCTKSKSTSTPGSSGSSTRSARGTAAAAVTNSPTPAATQYPAMTESSLRSKFATIQTWASQTTGESAFGSIFFSALTACRCIQTNPACTTRTVYYPAIGTTVYPNDNAPVTVTLTGVTATGTVRRTRTVTPTVYNASCA